MKDWRVWAGVGQIEIDAIAREIGVVATEIACGPLGENLTESFQQSQAILSHFFLDGGAKACGVHSAPPLQSMCPGHCHEQSWFGALAVAPAGGRSLRQMSHLCLQGWVGSGLLRSLASERQLARDGPGCLTQGQLEIQLQQTGTGPRPGITNKWKINIFPQYFS